MRRDRDLITAIASGVLVDDYGIRRHIVARQTKWHRYDASEPRRSDVAPLFGLAGDAAASRSRVGFVHLAHTDARDPRASGGGSAPDRGRAPPTVRERIHDDVSWLTRSDGLEAGGFLCGRPFWSWHRLIEVTTATSTGAQPQAEQRRALHTR